MTKRHVEIAIYALFIVAIMLAPLVLDSVLGQPAGQISRVRNARHRRRLVLGLCRRSQSRPGPVLRRRRLHARHVAEAREPDELAARLRQAGAGLHAVERGARLADRSVLHQQGVVPVDSVPEPMVRRRHGHRAAGLHRGRARHHHVPQAHRRRVRFDHHAGAGSVGAAPDHRRAALDQRFQRPDRSRLVQAVRFRVRSVSDADLLSGRRLARDRTDRFHGF